MVIPIVDLSKSTTIFRLKQMGITNYIPIAQMDNQGGQFGVPIMTSNNRSAQEGLKCTNYFNFGNIRHLPWILNKDCFEITSILVVTSAFYSIIAVLHILLQIDYISIYFTLI